MLLQKLTAEMEQNQHTKSTIDKLLRYSGQIASDGIVGLEAKLAAGHRGYETEAALEKKELFAKLLERFSLYASAQEILAHLLARVEYHFTQFVYPQIGELSVLQVNALVDANIVAPTVQECGSSVFAIDHNVAMGMIYWLAERCYVRWHQ